VAHHVELLRVEEDELHLNDGEKHASGGIESDEDVLAVWILLELEVLSKLQARVDHRSNAERDRTNTQVETSVADHALLDAAEVFVAAFGFVRINYGEKLAIFEMCRVDEDDENDAGEVEEEVEALIEAFRCLGAFREDFGDGKGDAENEDELSVEGREGKGEGIAGKIRKV
jgi:hypothetical protein